MGGAGNTVSVWGGDNMIDAGGGGSHVTILGLDGTGIPTPTDPDGPDDAPVPLSPTDYVTISGAGDSVSATYENVNISGAFGWSRRDHHARERQQLGRPRRTPGDDNHVTVGNGGNAINVTGNSNALPSATAPTASR